MARQLVDWTLPNIINSAAFAHLMYLWPPVKTDPISHISRAGFAINGPAVIYAICERAAEMERS